MLPVQILNHILIEEENILEDRRLFNLERRLMRDESDPFSIEDDQFTKLFRLRKEPARHVLNVILPNMNLTNNVVAIHPTVKYFCTMSFYATGSYQRTIGQSYNLSISQQSVSRAIKEITEVIVNTLAQQWIRFPIDGASKNSIKGGFMEKHNFPGIIGCIDCTHVAILKPAVEEHNYLNRKGFHSKNIQIVSIFYFNFVCFTFTIYSLFLHIK